MARKLRGRKKDSDEDERAMEAVPGGNVRRVVFESEPARAPERRSGEKRYRPRHRASINEIEAEVDRIAGGRRRRFRLQRHESAKAGDDDWESREAASTEKPLYRTEQGSRITEAERHEADRKRRILYLRDHPDHPREGRRFSHTLVDRVIKDVDLAEEEVVEEPAKKPARRPAAKKTTKKAAAKRSTGSTGKKTAAKKRGGPAKRSAKATSSKKTTKKATGKKKPAKAAPQRTAAKRPAKGDKDYQPQCLALTGQGKQCRNSARKGSKYCASHKGYHAKGFKSHMSAQDTKPRSKKAKDTKPVAKKATGQGTDQCLALTKAGKQCRNSSQDGRKYCANHKGYRGKKAVMDGMDTKPRHAKAKDTKPALRK